MLKLLLAGALVLASTPVAPAIIVPTTDVQIQCPVPGGYSMGTGFRVGKGVILSVNHVTRYEECTINGRKISATAQPDLDFSVILADIPGPTLQVDCNGFQRGHSYIARGFARGLPYETNVDLVGTGEKEDRYSILKGVLTVIPGQSGGPVIDTETGKVVGTVNIYDMPRGLSGSIALKDTVICHA